MPATSKAQQQAAGIAHAVEKGELPKSKLKGASKQMYKGMAGKGELHKFAATKTKDLPKHVSEGAESVANLFGRTLLDERGRHKAGCQCGFCKNMGSFGKKKDNDTEKEPDEPKEPEVSEAHVAQVPYVDKTGKSRQVPWVRRDKKPLPGQSAGAAKPPAKMEGIAGEVKLSTGTTKGAANKAYHNMTSKQAMTPEWKPKQYIKAAAEATNQTGRMKGFKNQSAGEDTSGKKLPKYRGVGESKSNAEQIVEALLG